MPSDLEQLRAALAQVNGSACGATNRQGVRLDRALPDLAIAGLDRTFVQREVPGTTRPPSHEVSGVSVCTD